MKLVNIFLLISLFSASLSQDNFIGSITLFYPSETEINKMSKTDSEEFNESFADYAHYSFNMDKFFEKHKIKVIHQTKPSFTIKLNKNKKFKFDRLKENVSFGFIFSDNKKTKVYKYVYTGIDIMYSAEEFFGIKVF